MAIEVLYKKALERLKDRYLNFLFVTVLGWGIGIGIALFLGLEVGVVLLIWALVKSPSIVGTVAVVASVLFLGVLIYFSSWAQLATVDSLIQTKKLTPFETYKKVRPFIKDFVVFMALTLLFFVGLFPFTVLSFLIVGLLWGLWGIFAVFVFLEKRQKGLRSLWISRDMVNQKFWPVAGVALLTSVLILIVTGLFVTAKNGLVSPIVTQLLLTPFITSVYFETYRTLKVPNKGKTPKVWMGLSIAGLVVAVLIVAFTAQVLTKAIPTILKDKNLQKEFLKEMEKSPSKNAI